MTVVANILEIAVAFAAVLGGYSFWIAKFIDSRFDALSVKIDGVERSLGARVDGVEKSLGARIDGVETRVGNIERRLDAGPSAA
jgi:hypothetical protein